MLIKQGLHNIYKSIFGTGSVFQQVTMTSALQDNAE